MGQAGTLSLKNPSAQSAPAYDQWEYNVRFPRQGEPSINDLAPLGEQGWELCTIRQVTGGASEFIYKRRKQS